MPVSELPSKDSVLHSRPNAPARAACQLQPNQTVNSRLAKEYMNVVLTKNLDFRGELSAIASKKSYASSKFVRADKAIGTLGFDAIEPNTYCWNEIHGECA